MAPPDRDGVARFKLAFLQHCEVSVLSFYLEAIMYGIFVLFGFYCVLGAIL